MAVYRPAARAGQRSAEDALNDDRGRLLAEIRESLAAPQKRLPTKLLYDERGSELFEAITALPEYYPTRSELALLHEHVPRWLADVRPRTVVELGAGSAAKTRVILDGMQARGGGTYVPVDISADFLARTAEELRQSYLAVDVVPVAADFSRFVDLPAALPRPLLITFLGSTIGNFTPDEAVALLQRVAGALHPGDRFLLGVDLRKDPRILEAAYNDAQGITAEFNLNLLSVVNRRFDANFDLSAFEHRAIYDSRLHRIEMHLEAVTAQRVAIPGAGEFAFDAGDTILTEISCKYDRPTIEAMFAVAGLGLEEWVQGGERPFGLTLAAQRVKTD